MSLDYTAIYTDIVKEDGIITPSFRLFLEQLMDTVNNVSANVTSVDVQGDVYIVASNLTFNNNSWPLSLPDEYSVLNRDDNLALSWTPPVDLNLSPEPGKAELFFGTTAPTGWIIYDGGTIGATGSGASTRANNDTEDLYTFLWNTLSNTQAPVSSGRGATAAADFAALKTISLTSMAVRLLANTGINDLNTNKTHLQTEGDNSYFITADMYPAHTHTAYYTKNTDVSSTIAGKIALGKNNSSGGTIVNISTYTTDINVVSEKYDTSSSGITYSKFNIEQPSVDVNIILKL